jgi:hypothetical protein
VLELGSTANEGDERDDGVAGTLGISAKAGDGAGDAGAGDAGGDGATVAASTAVFADDGIDATEPCQG